MDVEACCDTEPTSSGNEFLYLPLNLAVVSLSMGS
jgi:hypothetical protein